MNKILSICIPTYNRKKYLKECLKMIIPQAKKFDIPLYISDNASSDGTSELLNRFSIKYKFLYYKNQKKNIGIDRNMLEVLSLAKSKYAWWFGDDDILVEGGLQYLLDMLNKKEEDISFILLNARHISYDLKRELEGTTIRIVEDTFYNDCRSFFRDHCFHMPFGTLIVNTHKLQSLDFTRFFGTSHAYSGTVLDYLAKEFSETGKVNIIVIAKPIIYLRSGEKTWSNYSAKLMLVGIPNWFDKLDKIFYIDVQRIRQSYLVDESKFKKLLNHRASGQMGFFNLNYLTKNLSFRGKINSILVSLLPSNAAKIISKFIRRGSILIKLLFKNKGCLIKSPK